MNSCLFSKLVKLIESVIAPTCRQLLTLRNLDLGIYNVYMASFRQNNKIKYRGYYHYYYSEMHGLYFQAKT